MIIPPEYGPGNPLFVRTIESWACRMLRRRGFSCKDEADIVQEAYIRVAREPEPAVAVRNWPSFLYKYVSYVVLEYCRKEARTYPAGTVSLDDSNIESYAASAALIDHKPSPEQALIASEGEINWQARQDMLPYLLKAAIAELSAEGKLSGAKRVECFSDVVMRYISHPDASFDTHRQYVEKLCQDTPPKATAARWWALVTTKVQELAEVLEAQVNGGYVS